MDKISKGIVISCTEKSRPFYEDLCKTLKTKYPILFSWEGVDRPENSHEYAAVANGVKIFDEFIFLHNTMLIKDNSIFDKMFEIEGHVALSESFYHLMGKFVSNNMPEIPVVHSKAESISRELNWFNKPYTVFEDKLPVTSNEFVGKYGRTNMVLENKFLIKLKGHWGQPFSE